MIDILEVLDFFPKDRAGTDRDQGCPGVAVFDVVSLPGNGELDTTGAEKTRCHVTDRVVVASDYCCRSVQGHPSRRIGVTWYTQACQDAGCATRSQGQGHDIKNRITLTEKMTSSQQRRRPVARALLTGKVIFGCVHA